jgi:hypothetical protein
MRGKFLRTAGVVVFGLIAGLVLLEIGLRVVLGNRVDFDRAYRQYDPYVGHVHAPDLDIRVPFEEHPEGYFDLVTESNGLREDADVLIEKADSVQRVLILGDSHTDATVFNRESYPNVLESLMLDGGINVEVLNAGVSDYDPLQELLWYTYYGRDYSPDVVVLGVYVGNDLLEMQGFDTIAIEAGQLMIDGARHVPVDQPLGERFSEWLGQFYIYSIVRWSVIPAVVSEADPGGHNRAFQVCRGCYWQSLNQASRFEKQEIDYDSAVARFREIVMELDQFVRAEGGQLVVLLIPTKRQVEGESIDEEQYLETAGELGLSGDGLDFDDRALADMIAVLDESGLPYINPLATLREAAVILGGPLYYETDWHLNPDGHTRIAVILYRYFTEINWPDDE